MSNKKRSDKLLVYILIRHTFIGRISRGFITHARDSHFASDAANPVGGMVVELQVTSALVTEVIVFHLALLYSLVVDQRRSLVVRRGCGRSWEDRC